MTIAFKPFFIFTCTGLLAGMLLVSNLNTKPADKVVAVNQTTSSETVTSSQTTAYPVLSGITLETSAAVVSFAQGTKTVYSSSGLVIKAHYESGETVTSTNPTTLANAVVSYDSSAFRGNLVGNYPITVKVTSSFTGNIAKSATYYVTVKTSKNDPSYRIDTSLVRLVFQKNSAFSYSGLVVEHMASDGTYSPITNFTVNASVTGSTGTKDASVVINKVTVQSYSISVVPTTTPIYTSFTVTLSSTTIPFGSSLSYTVVGTKTNGTKIDVTSLVAAVGFNNKNLGSSTVELKAKTSSHIDGVPFDVKKTVKVTNVGANTANFTPLEQAAAFEAYVMKYTPCECPENDPVYKHADAVMASEIKTEHNAMNSASRALVGYDASARYEFILRVYNLSGTTLPTENPSNVLSNDANTSSVAIISVIGIIAMAAYLYFNKKHSQSDEK